MSLLTASVADRIAVNARARTRASTIPWPLYAVVVASTCIVVGLIWDVSWHRTVGRDTFWTLAHVLEQVAAVIAGLSCGWLVLKTTYAGSPQEKAQSVRFWRFFQGPLGAWVCIWGTLMMIVSAPFDNWWHNAYGLDVKIISPPHMVLAWGMIGIQIGAMLMTLSAQNRASPEDQKMYSLMHAYAAGILVTMIATVIMEDASVGNHMHSSKFYAITAWTIPIFLIGLSRASRLQWPATTITAIYSVITLLMMWILQLFPGTPNGPHLQSGDPHGAAGVSAAHNRAGAGGRRVDAEVRSPQRLDALADDRCDVGGGDGSGPLVLGGVPALARCAQLRLRRRSWSYSARPGAWRYQYWNLDVDAAGKWSALRFARGIGLAMILAVVASRLSLFWGNGMSKVKR